jgi:hypothetical protein
MIFSKKNGERSMKNIDGVVLKISFKGDKVWNNDRVGIKRIEYLISII